MSDIIKRATGGLHGLVFGSEIATRGLVFEPEVIAITDIGDFDFEVSPFATLDNPETDIPTAVVLDSITANMQGTSITPIRFFTARLVGRMGAPYVRR